MWLLRSGRGSGKTRAGGEWVIEKVRRRIYRRLAFVAMTAADYRDTMIEGESGILAISPPDFRPKWEPSKRRLTWPNGAIATCYSAEEPDSLRGPQHDAAWADELAAWKKPEAWDQLQFGLRLGRDPRVVVTTTPRPTKLIKELVADELTVQTHGSTYDNAANLAEGFLREILRKYEGTRLGRQELMGEIIEDTPGALWTHALLEELRIQERPDLDRIVVAIDPSVTAGEDSDEAGVIVAGRAGLELIVLEDLSGVMSPTAWATRAVDAYHAWGADRIVAEVNNGGDMVETTIRAIDPAVPYRAVSASRGKRARAEPVSALYEQGRAHHLGMFAKLEDQQCQWVPGQVEGSPDRVDALVWAAFDLLLRDKHPHRRRARSHRT